MSFFIMITYEYIFTRMFCRIQVPKEEVEDELQDKLDRIR